MSVLDAAREALIAAERIDTPLGQAALVLAEKLDDPDTAPTALANIGRELRLTLADALANATMAADPIDELKARRERRQRGA